MRESNIFSLCVSPREGGGDLGQVPVPDGGGGGGGGYTHPSQWDGMQSRTASTSYAVGGMPLAFTQEDFLVLSHIYADTLDYF